MDIYWEMGKIKDAQFAIDHSATNALISNSLTEILWSFWECIEISFIFL